MMSHHGGCCRLSSSRSSFITSFTGSSTCIGGARGIKVMTRIFVLDSNVRPIISRKLGGNPVIYRIITRYSDGGRNLNDLFLSLCELFVSGPGLIISFPDLSIS